MSAANRAPARATPIVLDPTSPSEEALRRVVRSCLAHLQANAGMAARGRDPEYLHQARVAMRRMRSALRLCHPADQAAGALRDELRWLSAALGPARDWDVFAAETLPPILEEYARTAGTGADLPARRLADAAKRRRSGARRTAREALASPRFAALLDAVVGWLETPGLPDLQVTPLPRFAARELRKCHKRLVRQAGHLQQLGAEQRHEVRIAAKRLRYAVEFFASLFPAREARAYAGRLGGLQDALGALNDCVAGRRLASGLPRSAGLTPYVLGWLEARESDGVAAADAALRRLQRSRPFWADDDA